VLLLAELSVLDAVQNNFDASQNFIFCLVNLSRYEMEIVTKNILKRR